MSIGLLPQSTGTTLDIRVYQDKALVTDLERSPPTIASPAAECSLWGLHWCYKCCAVVDFVFASMAAFRAFVRSRAELTLEILTFRKQVAVLKRKRPRPSVKAHDSWHRTAFRRHWRCRSRRPPGKGFAPRRESGTECRRRELLAEKPVTRYSERIGSGALSASGASSR